MFGTGGDYRKLFLNRHFLNIGRKSICGFLQEVFEIKNKRIYYKSLKIIIINLL